MAKAVLSICTIVRLSVPTELPCSGSHSEVSGTEIVAHVSVTSACRVGAVARVVGMRNRKVFPVATIPDYYVDRPAFI